MSDEHSRKLNFELPGKTDPLPHRRFRWLSTVLIILLIGLGIHIWISLKSSGVDFQRGKIESIDAGQLKQIALRLEKNGLNDTAAAAWKEYIDKAALTRRDAALIWYQIGKLYQDNHDYERALDAYYRSEGISTVDSIAYEINQRVQECLESMGKFSARERELADRVSMEPAGKSGMDDPVVAEIGTRKITASEIERRMENDIEQQISLMAPYLPDEDRKSQKEALLGQLSNPTNRMMFVNQFVGEELLYQKAREEKLTDDQHIRDILEDQKRGFLAAMALEKEYADQINITPSDLETYFEANKKTFMKEGKEPAFEDVKNDVYKTLRAKKEQDVRQALLTRLKDHYDVVIHQSAFGSPSQPQEGLTGKDINAQNSN